MNVIIIGGGKVGTYLASMLISGGHKVKVIEARREEIKRLDAELGNDVTICGNGSDPEVLEAANIRQAQVVAAVTGADEVNLVVTNLARFEFNVSRTIGRINNPKNAWLFTPDMGVDVALNQADLIGRLIAEEMSLGDMMTLMKLRKGQYSLVEEKVAPDALVVGKPLSQLNLPARCIIAAVIRKDQLILPHGETILQPADEVLAIVHATEVLTLARYLGGSLSKYQP